MHGTRLEDVGVDEWNWVIGVNVLGVINGIRAFVPMIRRHGEGGHVVNTASISGFFIRRGRNQGAYSMTKYAVVALSEALEQEVEDTGIGVSVLCPGSVDTRIFASSATRPERFGGPYERPQQTAMRGAMGRGIAPDMVGQRVLHAIRNNEFYVLTHAGERDAVKARHERIDAAFDRAEAWQKAR
jgi:NAD(P)-dependent dehydrogenase (short-subunit alcohol dehydrogenase family)